MNEIQIKINNKKYILKFGMYFLRQLSIHWELPYFNDVIKKFLAFEKVDPENFSWDIIDIVVDIYYIGISSNKDNDAISKEELYEEVLKDMEQTLKVIKVMTSSLVTSFGGNGKKPIPANKK